MALPSGLPPLDVTPGPSVVEPLPADRPVRWGILATGKIARAFATALGLVPDAEIAAVAARRIETAREFAAEHGAGTAYGSYRELVEDPDVDVVYVASPHGLHREHVLMALESGKPVLCEKALTLNARHAAELVAVAREKQLFLMEAMWMRCNPTIRRIQQVLATGQIGSVTQVRADLGFRVVAPPTDRLLDPALGGGALLDMGVYPLTFAHLFLGEPSQVAAAATLSDLGVDAVKLRSSMRRWSSRTELAARLSRPCLAAPLPGCQWPGAAARAAINRSESSRSASRLAAYRRRHSRSVPARSSRSMKAPVTRAASDGESVWAFRYSSQHQSRTLFHSTNVAQLRDLHPEVEMLRTLGDDTRFVVSEPLRDLPGAWREVPESSCGIIQPGDDEIRAFAPVPPAHVA